MIHWPQLSVLQLLVATSVAAALLAVNIRVTKCAPVDVIEGQVWLGSVNQGWPYQYRDGLAIYTEKPTRMDGKIHWGEVDYYSLLKNVAFCLVLLLVANIVAGALSKPYGKRQCNR